MIARNWLLGRRIVEEELVGGNSENYGKKVIARMSEELTRTFGKGFTTSNLYMFSQFYRMFPEMFHTLCGKSRVLSWSHYRELIRVPSDRDQLYAAKFLEHLPSETELRREIEAQKGIYRQMGSHDQPS